MANNQVAVKKQNFASFVKQPQVVGNLAQTLGSVAKSKEFLASVTSAVSTNPDLQKCDFGTIVSSALIGNALKLSPSPQLGYFYLVPFNDRKNNRTTATFQLGYKGYLQLAIRSGQYEVINVGTIKEGELVSWNPFTETLDIEPIDDEDIRDNTPTSGYFATFKLINGFKKTIYWKKSKMESHANKYSKGYAAKKGYTFWEKDFDSMAQKTMLRQLLSKWGIMSVEMQTAFEKDETYEDNEGNNVHFDNVVEDAEVVEQVQDQNKTDAPF